MAAIDDLLAKIDDPSLRRDLEAELAALRNIREYGLVFERHIPEKVRLPGLPIVRGSTVEVRSDLDSPTWQVTRIDGSRAQLARTEPSGSKITEARAMDELIAVCEFGRPIYPALRSLGKVERGEDKPYHIVINAENFHALELLLYTCRGQVDAIYVDPPFNSGGARDWKYNNNYVGKDDNYRHSKWLAFMERRLKLAKELLNPDDSVLIVAIDENELHRLALLLEDLFPASKIQMVSVVSNPAGASIIDQFDRVDEQLLFIHLGRACPIPTIALTTPSISDMRKEAVGQKTSRSSIRFRTTYVLRSGGNSLRSDTKAKFFPIYIDEAQGGIVGCGEHLPPGEDRTSAPKPPRGSIGVWPLKQDGTEACWQLSAPTFRRYLAEGRVRLGRKKKDGSYGMTYLTESDMGLIKAGEVVVVGKDKNGALLVEHSSAETRLRDGKTVWTNEPYSAREHGGRMLRDVIPGRRFPFPKSLYAVEDALRFYVGNKPNALVLDFFAGSGTTAHAVFRLNHADNGRRRSIHVTNNEVSDKEAETLSQMGLEPGDPDWEALGIFQHITRPRIESAIKGVTPEGSPIDGEYRFIDEFAMSEGLNENVEFFQLTYEDPDLIQLRAAFPAIAPVLWLMAGAEGPRVEEEEEHWALPIDAKYGVLFDTDSWPDFSSAVTTSSRATHAFIVTDSEAVFQRVAGEMPDHIQTVRLYRSYLETFAINMRGRS
jgi:adenine-specific DNA-methyltransferase